MKCLQIIISGKVQGVFYRVHAQKKAIELNLKGFVMNKGDGSVYIEVEGHTDHLEKFVEWCWKGPEKARVSSVVTKEISLNSYPSFEIKK